MGFGRSLAFLALVAWAAAFGLYTALVGALQQLELFH